MNSRLKAVFGGIATGVALVVVLNSGSAVYNHYFGEGHDHDHSAVAEPSVPQKPLAKKFSPGEAASMKLTAEEMAMTEKYAMLQGCLGAAQVGIEMAKSLVQGGEVEMAETPQAAFDRAVSKCQADSGMTVDEANAFVGTLEEKYGDVLETVYRNSVPQKPVAP